MTGTSLAHSRRLTAEMLSILHALLKCYQKADRSQVLNKQIRWAQNVFRRGMLKVRRNINQNGRIVNALRRKILTGAVFTIEFGREQVRPGCFQLL
jgi:23S rRNA C2498 (ribose-2'-O)-methylase RlmM